jgi:hypothetical protein
MSYYGRGQAEALELFKIASIGKKTEKSEKKDDSKPETKKEAAGRFNNPMAMKAMANNQRLGDAFKAHTANAAATGPVTSNVALTKPTDMTRANDLAYWTGQANNVQAPMAPAAPATKLTGMDKIRAMQQQKIGRETLAMFGVDGLT